jgi:hypothetical protein
MMSYASTKYHIIKGEIMKEVLIGIALILFYYYFIGDESGCDKYASRYSCSYVVEKADYAVFYWKYLPNDNAENEIFLGNTKGLQSCRNLAATFAAQIEESWNERAYICVLVKDGNYMEKHRLL